MNGAIDAWIRPVGDRPSSELILRERWYASRQQVEVGDVFLIALKGKKAHAYQPENHLVHSDYCCTNEGKATYDQLKSIVDQQSGPVWLNGFSTAYGQNDQVPENAAPSLGSSLKLISVDDLEVVVAHEWPTYDNRRTLRGAFSAFGHRYALSITDPAIEAEFSQHADGRYFIGSSLLCVSLGEPYQQHAYKLIAAVIRKGFYGIA